jgi:hypothetical protein
MEYNSVVFKPDELGARRMRACRVENADDTEDAWCDGRGASR